MDISFYIDMLQSSKKTMTDAIIKDKALNKFAHEYIDTQTAFAKRMVKNAQDMMEHFVSTQSHTWFPGGESK